jgi:hypothetical protein
MLQRMKENEEETKEEKENNHDRCKEKYENMVKFRDFVNSECAKMRDQEDARMCREFADTIQRECDMFQTRLQKEEK